MSDQSAMNKCIVAILIVLKLSDPTQAQSTNKTEKSLSFGIKGGVAFSTIFVSAPVSITDLTGSSFTNRTVTGNMYGVMGRYLSEKHFGLQIEANYTQKGWKEVFQDAQSNVDPNRSYQVSLDYLTVPILAHGHFGQRHVQIFLNAGFYLAYLLAYETVLSENALDHDEITFPYQEVDQNSFDLGIQGSGGVEIVTAAGNVQLESGYALGLNSVVDKYAESVPTTLQNSTFWVALGYLYAF